MQIFYKTASLEKLCTNHKKAARRWGQRRADVLFRRLDQLRAANNLAILSTAGAGRPHELTGNLQGKISVDLDHPYRLIFEPWHDPLPTKEDGGLDWTKATAVRILGVEDTHG